MITDMAEGSKAMTPASDTASGGLTTRQRLIVTGPSRCGTTLLASVLSKLGISFGLEDKKWDINSGYYEHPLILRTYGLARKWKRALAISDHAGEFFRRKSVSTLAQLLNEVQAIKYPPLSTELPRLVRDAGFEPLILIPARRFQSYCLSRMRKEDADWQTCKRDYLNTYNSSFFAMKLYGGAVFGYEDLYNEARSLWIPPLMRYAGVDEASVRTVLSQCVSEHRSQAWQELADAECDALYDRLLSSCQR